MSIGRGKVASQCGTKSRYGDKDEARRHVQRLMEHGGPKLAVYRCEFCKYWHVGRRKKDRDR